MARRAVLTLVERFVRDGGTYMKAAALAPSATGTQLDELRLSSGNELPPTGSSMRSAPGCPSFSQT